MSTVLQYKAPAPRGGKAAAAPSSMYDDGSYGSANSRGGTCLLSYVHNV